MTPGGGVEGWDSWGSSTRATSVTAKSWEIHECLESRTAYPSSTFMGVGWELMRMGKALPPEPALPEPG